MMLRAVRVLAHPSLALIKYWGKQPDGTNIPATSSLAVSLDALVTETEIYPGADTTKITVDGETADPAGYARFFTELYRYTDVPVAFDIRSRNSFPAAAGLASSSSGYAALAVGCAAACGLTLSTPDLSRLARTGSGSAARAVFPGVTRLRAGSETAEPFRDAAHWPELRIGLGIVRRGRKEVASRAGMNTARDTSPFFPAWIGENELLFQSACEAFLARDLPRLGELMRRSYLCMFATMFSSSPPLIYWKPETVAVIHAIDNLRSRGFQIWETMDAGPQVKFVCTADILDEMVTNLREAVPAVEWITSKVGGAPRIEYPDSVTAAAEDA